jgi:hypothetical protein
MNMVDYAYPCMMAEAALKKLHWAMLDRRYDDAIEAGHVALAETLMTVAAIRHEQKKQSTPAKVNLD